MGFAIQTLSHFPAKRPVQQRLKQMLRLPFRFPLLRTQTLKLLDDARKFLLERERRDKSRQFLDFLDGQSFDLLHQPFAKLYFGKPRDNLR